MLCLLVVSDLELPRAISQETPINPFWDFASDYGVDGLRGVLH